MSEQNSVEYHQHRKFKIKAISRGVAFVIVGGFIAWVGWPNVWAIGIGAALALAGAGMVLQGSRIDVSK